MFECGKAAQVAKEMKQNRVEILGVSEARWKSGKLVLADGTTVIYSGRKDGLHQEGVALMLLKGTYGMETSEREDCPC